MAHVREKVKGRETGRIIGTARSICNSRLAAAPLGKLLQIVSVDALQPDEIVVDFGRRDDSKRDNAIDGGRQQQERSDRSESRVFKQTGRDEARNAPKRQSPCD